MKNILILFLLATLTSGTVQIDTEAPEDYIMRGAWQLESFYLFENDQIVDTVETTDGYRQIKMYTNDKVMWTRYVPENTTEWFGYGHYEATDSTLEERLEYGSASMMEIIDTMRVFTFKLEMHGDRFSQINVSEDGKRFSSENYIRIE
ncbi:MAG: hypothetical protein WBG71_10260 [Leeuwenhoekiella sp.]